MAPRAGSHLVDGEHTSVGLQQAAQQRQRLGAGAKRVLAPAVLKVPHRPVRHLIHHPVGVDSSPTRYVLALPKSALHCAADGAEARGCALGPPPAAAAAFVVIVPAAEAIAATAAFAIFLLEAAAIPGINEAAGTAAATATVVEASRTAAATATTIVKAPRAAAAAAPFIIAASTPITRRRPATSAIARGATATAATRCRGGAIAQVGWYVRHIIL